MGQNHIEVPLAKPTSRMSPNGSRFAFPRITHEEAAGPRAKSERVVNANAVDGFEKPRALSMTGTKSIVKKIERPRRTPIAPLHHLHLMPQRNHRTMQPVHEDAVARRMAARVRMAYGKDSQTCALFN